MVTMAKKRSKPMSSDHEDENKRIQIAIPPAFITPLKALCDANATTYTEEVKRAIRELLQREGLWPPRPTSPQDGV